MPKKYPEEFKRDVVRAAKNSQSPLSQIARDFGISGPTLYRWIQDAVTDDGPQEVSIAEYRRLRQRTRELEQENEILRRAAAYFAKDALPK